MWLKALLELLLLPPVNLVFAILAGVALRRRAPRVARYLIVVGATLLLALGMPAVAGTLLWSLEQGLPMTPPPGKPPQAIVILGGDVARTAHGGATAGSLSLERERAGAILQRQTQLPILVTGGLIDDDPPPVADVMRDSLTQDFRVPGTLGGGPLARHLAERARQCPDPARQRDQFDLPGHPCMA